MKAELFITLVFLLFAGLTFSRAADGVPAKPGAHQVRDVEGWKVHVDERLLAEPESELGVKALKLLEGRLFDIVMVLPADKVARLQEVPIWLDLSHGGLKPMQYHPSAEWLKENGYDPALAKCVHIPDAAQFASARHHHTQPWATLHELAHAYHDQVLGFEQNELLEAWSRFCKGGKYQKVRHINGNMVPHYALTDQKEFFAEMTESYFGLNDFYPFQRDDLRQAEPAIFALMKSLWGPLP